MKNHCHTMRTIIDFKIKWKLSTTIWNILLAELCHGLGKANKCTTPKLNWCPSWTQEALLCEVHHFQMKVLGIITLQHLVLSYLREFDFHWELLFQCKVIPPVKKGDSKSASYGDNYNSFQFQSYPFLFYFIFFANIYQPTIYPYKNPYISNASIKSNYPSLLIFNFFYNYIIRNSFINNISYEKIILNFLLNHSSEDLKNQRIMYVF